MFHFTKLLLALGVLSLSVSATDFAVQKGKIDDIEKFYYDQGTKDGYNIGYKEGYYRAIKDAKASLDRYKELIKAREAGKYFSKEHKITYPEIYSVKTADGIRVRVRGCQIDKELTAGDILKAPIVNADFMAGDATDYFTLNEAERRNAAALHKPTNSVVLVARDQALSEVPLLPGNETKRAKRHYINTAFLRHTLDENNIAYSVTEKEIHAIFSSEEDAKTFDSKYKLD